MYTYSITYTRQPGVVDHLLREIEPKMFWTEEPDDAWYKECKLDLLCFGLRVPPQAALPTETHEMDKSVQSLTAAISQHYANIGKPLSTPEKSPEKLLMGYFEVDEKKITCILDQKVQKTVVDLSYAQDLRIANPMRHDSDVIITVGGRESNVNSLHAEFANDGVAMPSVAVQWLSDCLQGKEKEEAPTPAKKSRLSSGSSAGTTIDLAEAAAPRPAERRRAVLSSALRKRLAER